VFAGGFINTGGPACTLSVSTDGGSTWSCTTFPNVVNDVQIKLLLRNELQGRLRHGVGAERHLPQHRFRVHVSSSTRRASRAVAPRTSRWAGPKSG